MGKIVDLVRYAIILGSVCHWTRRDYREAVRFVNSYGSFHEPLCIYSRTKLSDYNHTVFRRR
jgi:hypothetical protein